MRIARSTYYDRPELAVDETGIVEAIASICDEFEVYGYRRVRAALRHQGIVVNHKKIRRLMREHDLQPRCVSARNVAMRHCTGNVSTGACDCTPVSASAKNKSRNVKACFDV
jgi:hypothetical protein